MSSPWQYFDRIFCINLPNRLGRRSLAEMEFNRVGVTVEFFDAIAAHDGRIGLMRSLLEIFTKVRDCNNVLIFEDDVEFCNDSVSKLSLALSDLHYIFHDQFDMLYFGGNVCGDAIPVSSNLRLIHGTLAAHAICYNKRMFAAYTEHLNRISEQGFVSCQADISDVFLTELQQAGKTLMVHPVIATQRPGWSDIEKNFVDYTDILKTKV